MLWLFGILVALTAGSSFGNSSFASLNGQMDRFVAAVASRVYAGGEP